MGFFDFLKKKETMDVPPTPPEYMGEENLPELPELPSFEFLQKKPVASPTIPKFIPPPSLFPEEEIRKESKKLRPVYAKVLDYKKSLDAISDAKKILNETEAHIIKITDLELGKEKFTSKYQDRVEDIQRKLIFLDKVIFEQRR